MKQKSNKLAKLERNRYSIITEDLEHCYMCKKNPVDIHEIYGGNNRRQSMKYGFCIPLCRLHHRMVTNKSSVSLIFKKACQEKFEETHTREEFMKIIGKNYL